MEILSSPETIENNSHAVETHLLDTSSYNMIVVYMYFLWSHTLITYGPCTGSP